MQSINFKNVSFQYDTSPDILFDDLSFSLSVDWKTAIVGRNGRGKSTLLQLIHGSIHPRRGSIDRPQATRLFPGSSIDQHRSLIDVIKQQIAPFEYWEQTMEQLLVSGDEQSLFQYHEIFEAYNDHQGFEIDSLIARECKEIGLHEEHFHQTFSTLSGGEQTRALIAALFLQQDIFPLLDEPTNHLDMNGREILGTYLSTKRGFIIVSHDRHFLDLCCDHVVAINKNDLRVFQGNYSTWKQQMMVEEQTETDRTTNLEREIYSLEIAARQRRTWSLITEKEKTKAFDSGFISHKAAKVMKRALAVEQRIEDHLVEKQSLLKNKETIRPLVFRVAERSSEILLSIENATVEIAGRILLKNFSLTVRRGERIAIVGGNGTGKTTLLNVVRKVHPLKNGICFVPNSIHIINGYQIPLWNKGMIRDFLKSEHIDETAFRIIMGSFNIQGEIFERPLETFSYGELKKIDLCRSFALPNHLLVWDEPVNYIDIESKEQIERAILNTEPTMLFVEHDRTFIENIATRVINIPHNI